jgi:16S rRNA (guanine527-N7)-methyltransferase
VSSSRLPSRRPIIGPKDSAPKKATPAASESDNALWRIPEWFPTMDPKLAEALKTYHKELMKFNGKLNLISRSTEREADETHFADSLLASELLLKTDLGKKVFDIGSGNGLPGLILAICKPDTEFSLVESDARKCEFLKHMNHVLGLKNVQVMNVRLETLSGMDVAVSRGFASLSKALLAVNRLFNKGGKFYHLKGNNWSREIADIPSQLIAHWKPELIGEYSLPVSQVRRAVVCTKKS